MQVQRDFPPNLAVVLEKIDLHELETRLADYNDQKAAELREWQIQQIQKGIEEAEAGKTIPHEKVVQWVESWGSEKELPEPR
ncbi:MAG: hypothetical protein HQL69_02640 [Magnetococcales bacterium]|nr:hypothetical protein [Magnetococcales bacterium]